MEANYQYMLDLIRNMDERINDIEKLLKLLVVNDIVDDIKDSIIKEENPFDSEYQLSMVSNIDRVLEDYGLIISDIISVDDFIFYKIEVPDDLKIGIKDVLEINFALVEFGNVELLYYFNKLNGMLRKRLIEEDISFCITGKELHFCSKK